MKKLNQLLLIEAADTPLPPLYLNALQAFSIEPVTSHALHQQPANSSAATPQLVLLHSNLTSVLHLRQFIDLHSLLPLSSIIIVGDFCDEELCLLALEAGAEDCITTEQLTPSFIQRAVLLSLRRNRQETALVQGHQQLLACIQTTPNVAVQWYNSKGEVVFWNQASERIFGWPAADALGKNISELIAIPENKNFWLHKIRHLVTNPTATETQEWHFKYRDGSDGWCISTMLTIPSFDKEPWVVCTDVEITDCKKMEREARVNEEKYRSLIENQADAIAIFNQAGNILEVNSSASVLLNYSRAEFGRLAVTDMFPQQELQQHPLRFDELAQGNATIMQRTMRRKDGSLVETEVHAKHLWDGQFVACIRDLTQRIEGQHELKKEIDLSNSIINSLPGLFYLFTREGQYLRWNRQQEILSEYTAQEISGMKPLDFFDTKDRAAVQHAIDKTFSQGHAHVEAQLLTKSGKKIPFYFTGTAVNYAQTACLLGTGINLSALRNLEDELVLQKIAAQKKIMQAMIDAEEKEKEKLGQELHDNVNQILSVVRVYLSILNSNEVPEGITLEQTMHLVNKAINEIRHLSHSLAVSYKFEAGLTDALHDLVKNIQLTRDFTIEMNLPDRLNELTTENQKLAVYRIVQEQVSNIIKHAKPTKVAITITLTPGELLLLITDNGKGFNPAVTQKGLGLNNITNRTEALNGNVSVQSVPGKGCQVKVILPFEH